MTRGPHSTPETHPRAAALLDWVEGKLVGPLRRDVSAHVHACAACRDLATHFSSVTQALRAEAADRPPEDLVAWARAIPLGARQRSLRPISLLEIISDSWGAFREAAARLTLAPAPALRSGQPVHPGRRRVLLSAGFCDLDLQIDYPGPADPRRIRGQVLPAGPTRALWKDSEIRFVSEGRPRARARLDRRGEFLMPRVRPGTYRIEIEGPLPCASNAIEV